MRFKQTDTIFRVILRFIKKFIRRARTVLVSRWRNWKIKPSTADFPREAHVLVVKKCTYVSIAKICIESFCYFNPNHVVIVHVDTVTEEKIKESLRGLIRKKRVRISRVHDAEPKWQIQKIELISSISASLSIFMDADLKWNGPLPQIQNVTFFVNEFQLDADEDYKWKLQEVFPEKKTLGSMKNTSFFSWGGYTLSEVQKNRIFEIENILSNFYGDEKRFGDQNSGLTRMSEQLALSLAVEEMTDLKVEYLKSVDGFKDGAFVESSYFGATGASF
jgi:hypothetical protein